MPSGGLQNGRGYQKIKRKKQPVSQPPLFNETFYRELRLLLEWRRDVRRFWTDPLPNGLVEELVALASLAPSVGYSQPCRFVRVDDPERRASVIESYQRANRAALASYQGAEADLNRDGLAADALAARLSTHPSIGQRPGALQTSQEKIGSHGGTSFSDRFMAFGHWTDDG